MRYNTPAIVFFLSAAGLFGLSGCDDAGGNGADSRGGSSLSDVMNHKSSSQADIAREQEKLVKTLKENQDKALKAEEKRRKKEKEAAAQKNKDGDRLDGVNAFSSGAGVMTPEAFKTKEKDNFITIPSGGKGPRLVQINDKAGERGAGPRSNNAVTINEKDSTVERDGGPSILDNNGTKSLNPIEPPKRGFFDKLFRRDGPRAQMMGVAAAGTQIQDIDPKAKKHGQDLTKWTKASNERHDTMGHMLQNEMAVKRLDTESNDKRKSAAPKPDSRAAVVDLNDNKPGNGEVVPLPASTRAEDANGADADEAQARAVMEDEYQKGLRSRDAIAREASFRYAALQQRADAIPFLLNELKEDKSLAAFAAQCLGAIGKTNEAVESQLVASLNNRDSLVRQAAAQTVGRMRYRRAVPALLANLATEKSYPARSAYAEALGLIGDPSAIAGLRAGMQQSGEIEFVKISEALALARLGDPSGRKHLMDTMGTNVPALQMMGLMGMARLGDANLAGYLNAALESPNEEVWTTAVYLFARLGPADALPALRERLSSPNERFRHRAALAMGFLGSDEAMPFIEQAVRGGDLQERSMGCELLGDLGARDKSPLLIEKLHDHSPSVRQTAAVALARMNAVEALPYLVDASRGRNRADNPLGNSENEDVYERLIMLACVRILRGEKEDLIVTTLPSGRDRAWPEIEKEVSHQSVELMKMYKLVDVLGSSKQPVGVVKGPDGKEVLYRSGEIVAAGYRVTDIGLPSVAKDKTKTPGYMTLMRGNERVTMTFGGATETDEIKR